MFQRNPLKDSIVKSIHPTFQPLCNIWMFMDAFQPAKRSLMMPGQPGLKL
jgi:hypothetical protein